MNFFPRIYEDELLYSVLARYHILSGNTSLRDTIKDAFGKGTVIPVIDFPCNLGSLANNIFGGKYYDSQYLINYCTLFPVYSPFMSLSRRKSLLYTMEHNDGIDIKFRIGFIAGGICRKEGLYYCPKCVEEEIKTYNEAYFHRTHQVQGSFVCEKHGCLLKPYIRKGTTSRLEFIRLSDENVDMKNDSINDTKLSELMMHVSKEIRYLLDNDLSCLNQNIVYKKYRMLLRDKGFLTANGKVKWSRLQDEFIDFYGTELLEKFQSNIDNDNEYNWLKVAIRKPRRLTHPIRHILLIKFLCGNIENLIKFNIGTLNPFGEGPWPCLNPCCKNYRRLVIKECEVTADYKTREPVGTFTDECGFTYSRKAKDDTFKIGRIKNFGWLWKDKLTELIHKEIPIRVIAHSMGCDYKTVVKYAEILGLRNLINTNIKVNLCSRQKVHKKIDGQKYKEDVMELIRNKPGITRQSIRNILYKQYMWLYKNDRDWFNKNMPVTKRTMKTKHSDKSKYLWAERDIDICNLLKKEYEKIVSEGELKRVTKSLLGRRIGKLALLEKKIDKLPKTQRYLGKITETIEEYQLRRIDLICKRLFEEGKEFEKWKIIRLCGLSNNCMSEAVRKRIQYNQSKYLTKIGSIVD